jgi:hypothetical protein
VLAAESAAQVKCGLDNVCFEILGLALTGTYKISKEMLPEKTPHKIIGKCKVYFQK